MIRLRPFRFLETGNLSQKIVSGYISKLICFARRHVGKKNAPDLTYAKGTEKQGIADMSGEWIPVTERLPPVDKKVLYTCFVSGDGPEDYFTDVNAGYWDGEARNLPGDPAMKYDDSNDWEPCSHWMPLPEPPEVT